MNREEMKERLEAGEKPIDVAIAKWEEAIEEDDYEHLDSPSNCALCYVNNPGGFAFKCGNCVLSRTGERCPDDHSVFIRFIDTYNDYIDENEDLCNVESAAGGMLAVLKEAKQYLIDRGEY